VRIVDDEQAVLEGPRLRLVGVVDQIDRAMAVPRHEAPLGAGGEAGAAAAPQARLLDLLGDLLRCHLLQRLVQGAVAA